MLPQSSIRSSSESVPAIQSVPLVRSLIQTQPLTRRSRSADGSAPVRGSVWSATPLHMRVNVGGEVATLKMQPSWTIGASGSAGADPVERRERGAGSGVDAAEHLAAGRDGDERRVLRGGLGEDRRARRFRIRIGGGIRGRVAGRVVGRASAETGRSDEAVVAVVEPERPCRRRRGRSRRGRSR